MVNFGRGALGIPPTPLPGTGGSFGKGGNGPLGGGGFAEGGPLGTPLGNGEAPYLTPLMGISPRGPSMST